MSSVTPLPRAAWLSERLLLVTDTGGAVAITNGGGSSSPLDVERFEAGQTTVAICRVPAASAAQSGSVPVVIEVDGEAVSMNGASHARGTDLTAVLRDRLAGLDAQTREDLLSFIVKAAGQHLQGPGGLRLAKQLALIRDVLRERLPYCTVRADEPLGLHIDEIHALDEQTFWFKGWVWDADAPLASLTFISPEGCSVDVLKGAFRHRRRDVEQLYPRSSGFRPDTGFVACTRLEVASRLSSGWVVQARNVLGTGVEMEGPTVNRDLMAAKDSIVGDIETVELGRGELIADHIRPALDCVQRRVAEAAAVERVEQYGTPPSEPQVSLVVTVFSPADALEQQLAQFAHDPEIVAADLIYVVDSADVAEALLPKAEELHWLYGVPFRLVVLDERGGRIVKISAGASLALAPELLLLGPDVVPDSPGWLGRMLDFKATKERVGAVGPLLLDEDGSVQHAGMALARPSSQELGRLARADGPLWEPRHQFKGLPRTFPAVVEPRPVPALSSACLLVERTLFERVGGLRKLFLEEEYEAVDLCMRLGEEGYTNWYFPGVALHHLEGRSTPEIAIAAKQYDVLLNSRLWGERIETLAAAAPRPG